MVKLSSFKTIGTGVASASLVMLLSACGGGSDPQDSNAAVAQSRAELSSDIKPADPGNKKKPTTTTTTTSSTSSTSSNTTTTSGSATTSTTATTTTTTQMSGACQGSATPALAGVILPASVPQAQSSNDIVGFNLQNTTMAALPSRMFTFAQVFRQGKVLPTNALVARINGATYQVQMDALASWPDGSVKLGSITLKTPSLCARSTLPALLSKATSSDPVFNSAPVNLASAPINLNVTLAFTGGQYTGTQTVNLSAALMNSLASNPNYWLRGPLATQARVDVPLSGGNLHLTADVTAYADGTATADVQFNNDLTTILPQSGSVNPQAPLPPLQYTATINFQGSTTSRTVSQLQYTDWHIVLNSAGAPQLNVTSSTAPAINVQQDLANLQYSGAIMSYDRTTGVAYQPTQYGNAFYAIATVKASAGFGTPLATNGVTQYMPMTGGRADIGYTTMWNTVWLLTQNENAATIGLAQSDTSGAIPWNYKLANGRWLTPSDSSSIWVDSRGGPRGYTDGIANIADTSAWVPDGAHPPNLNYVPYILSGSRWYLDRLNAQAAFALTNSWPGARCRPSCGPNTNDIVLNGSDQIRQQAWALREIQEAAFIGRPGSFEHTYFNQVVLDNWNYVQSQTPALTLMQGEAAGWWPGYGVPTSASNTSFPSAQLSPWMEDYLTGIVAHGAQMGFAGARAFINWQKNNWLAGRFIAPTMNPYDGAAYRHIITSPTGVVYKTWADIEAATVANGFSNGSTYATACESDYCATARAALGSALSVYPGDAGLTQAFNWLNSTGAPSTTRGYFQNDPTFNVVPLQ